MAEVSSDFVSILKRLKKDALRHISCEICGRDIATSVHIQCLVCPNFFVCIPCFRRKRTKGNHDIAHQYMVKDTYDFPIYSGQWTAAQELGLLEGLRKHGYGNWIPVSELVRKPIRECESHFRKYYIASCKPEALLSSRTSDNSIHVATALMDVEESEASDEKFPIVATRVDPEPTQKIVTLRELAGYMEKRKDFEMEHDNDIELFLADLDFFDDDTSEDRDIKFKQLEVYNSVLDEREERKAFAIDRWELEIQNERKYSRNIVDKNVYTALKPIARFLPPEKFSSIVDNMIREQQLRKKLALLKEAKERGFQSEAQFKEFLRGKRDELEASVRRTATDSADLIQIEQIERTQFESTKNQKIFNIQDAPERTNATFCEELGISQSEFDEIQAEITEQLEANGYYFQEGEAPVENKRRIVDFIVDMKKSGGSS